MFTHRWFNKQIVVPPLFSNKKESLLVYAIIWVNLSYFEFKMPEPPTKKKERKERGEWGGEGGREEGRKEKGRDTRKRYVLYITSLIYNSSECKLICGGRKQTAWKTGNKAGNSQKGGIPKGHQETVRGDVHVHYLEGDDGFTGVYMCQVKLQTFNVCSFLYTS